MNKRIKKKKNLINNDIKQEELLDLDLLLAKYILPRLKEFKKMKIKSNVKTHPSDLTFEEWIMALDEMIWTFNYYIYKPQYMDDEQFIKDRVRYMAGMTLFTKYFSHLSI